MASAESEGNVVYLTEIGDIGARKLTLVYWSSVLGMREPANLVHRVNSRKA